MCAPQPPGQHRFHRDLLAKGTPQEIGHAVDKSAHIDRLGLERLLPGEGQKPLSECFSSPRPSHRVFGRPAQSILVRSVVIQVALQRFQIANDYREQIVKIVRNTASKLADAFHFMRLPQAFLGVASLREIARYLGETN